MSRSRRIGEKRERDRNGRVRKVFWGRGNILALTYTTSIYYKLLSLPLA